ncbi:MAG: TIGR04282 family arsenosugar biosynthesis glycosyltransferase [Dehalobacter sp.]|nr:TIGR04282 family arsenosugar biosynthesis glycosyltransferase [Dehalobacter sp.]
MKKVIAVMSKIPHPGYTKTRLQRVITDEESAAFHQASLRDILNTVNSTGLPGYVYWYSSLADLQSPNLAIWDDYHFQERLQQGNCLGERMQNIAEEGLSHYQSILIIGSDIPEISRAVLEEAFDRLREVDVVLGPAQDGGYYLIGLKKNCRDLFCGIPWSTSEVLKRTLQAVRDKGLTYSLLESLQDIDTWEDMLAYYRRGLAGKETYKGLQSYRIAELLVQKYSLDFSLAEGS